jgi:hypothetical protein
MSNWNKDYWTFGTMGLLDFETKRNFIFENDFYGTSSFLHPMVPKSNSQKILKSQNSKVLALLIPFNYFSEPF